MLTRPISDQRTARLRLLATIAGVYVLPVIALASGMIGPQWRFHVLVVMSILAALLAFARRYKLVEQGPILPRWPDLLRWSILPSAVVVAGMFALNMGHRFLVTQRLPFYAFFVLISAPAQEFLYRSFLFAELTSARLSTTCTVVVSSILFAFMHIIYRDALTLALTFAVGLVWGLVFTRTRSFCVVALSHAILGVGAIARGVI